MVILFLVFTVLIAVGVFVFIRSFLFEKNSAREKARLSAQFQKELQILEKEQGADFYEPEEAERQRLEIGRRFLAEMDALEEGTKKKRKSPHYIGIVFLLIIAPLSLVLYAKLGAPEISGRYFPEKDQMEEGSHLTLQQVVAMLERRLENQPEDVEGWRLLARSKLVLGEPAKARLAAEKALALRPEDRAIQKIWVQAHLAVIFSTAEPISPALQAVLDRLEQEQPEDPDILYLAGWTRFLQGDLQGAEKRYLRIRDLFPKGSEDYQAWDQEIERLFKP